MWLFLLCSAGRVCHAWFPLFGISPATTLISYLALKMHFWSASFVLWENSCSCHHETIATVAAVKLSQQLQLSSWNFHNSCSCHHEITATVAAVVMKLLQQLQLSSWNFSRIDFSSNCAKIQTTGTNNASSHYWVATSGECQSSAADREGGLELVLTVEHHYFITIR